jgi:hypothetical protein
MWQTGTVGLTSERQLIRSLRDTGPCHTTAQLCSGARQRCLAGPGWAQSGPGACLGTPIDCHAPSSNRPADAVKRHVAALRAFHTGLVSETHQHLYVLAQMARHLDVLRQPSQRSEEKLAAAHAGCRQLTRLERLKQPWREPYRDFRRSLQRVRTVYREIVKSAGRHR